MKMLRIVTTILVAAVLFPSAALAASPYTTSTQSFNSHSTTCMAVPGATPIQTGSTVAIPCTFEEITTIVTTYTQHIPHAVYTSEQTGNAWEQIGWTSGISGYHTVTTTQPYTAFRTVSYTQTYTAYRIVTSTSYHTYYETRTVRAYPFQRPVYYCYLRSGAGSGYICYVDYYLPEYNYTTVTVPVTVAYTSRYSVPYTAYRTVTTTQAYTAYITITSTVPTYGLIARYGWVPTYSQVQTGITWSTVAAGTSTFSTSTTISSWLDSTPLAGTSGSGNGTCGPGYCWPYFIIPIPTNN